MRAIIPVAGFGSRLRPHTHTIPKVLLNVAGKPILGHILDKLTAEGITKATFIYGHLGELVIDYVTNNYPLLQTDFIEQSEMKGLGHAIYLAKETFDDEELFITLGDTVFDVNLASIFDKKKSSLGIKEVKDPSRFGVALLKDNIIEKLIEKPQTMVSRLALVGLYYITNGRLLADCLSYIVENDIRTKGELQLTDALQLMIDRGYQFNVFPVDGWYDCGKPETLLETNRFLLEQSGYKFERDGVIVNHPVFIHNSARITNAIIGPNTTIGEDAVIENAIIMNSIIGAGAEIKNDLMQDSIIGNKSSIIGAFKRLNIGDSTEIEIF
ncbi:MAG: NTP transferase domain-containing protein [Ignavibacteriales bacterium]|nr:NTP transferase domain-containing protein [Ignavibacteriales bacterium]